MINKLRFFQVMMVFSVAIGAGIMITIYFLHSNPASTVQPDNEMSGVIASVEGSKFLVVNGVTVDEISNQSLEEIIESSEGASWFTADEEALSILEIYDEVKVYYSDMDDSYPGSGKAEKVERLE